jgi:putative membrane protein
MHWQQQGKEPDYRFSLANERTFLAWIRTALAILAGGVLFHQFAARLRPVWMVVALSVGLSMLAGLLALGAYQRWRANEIAMRHDQALPPSRLLPALTVAMTLLALLFAIFLWLQ